jgi:DNA repair protein RadC
MENNNKWEIGNLGEVTVSYVYKGKLKDRPIITESYDVYKLASKVLDQGALGMQEQFLAIYLNRSHRVLGAKVHFIGGVSSVIVDIKVIMATAVSLMASAVIVCHNHPSGNLEPSQQDKAMTSRLKDALALMDIQLLDHMILNPEGEFLSFVEKGIL